MVEGMSCLLEFGEAIKLISELLISGICGCEFKSSFGMNLYNGHPEFRFMFRLRCDYKFLFLN